jgi:hypothetical protein
MILNDFVFDFHGHFENQFSNQIPIFQCDFKNLKIFPKWFEIRFCKIVNQIVECPAQSEDLRLFRGLLAHSWRSCADSLTHINWYWGKLWRSFKNVLMWRIHDCQGYPTLIAKLMYLSRACKFMHGRNKNVNNLSAARSFNSSSRDISVAKWRCK